MATGCMMHEFALPLNLPPTKPSTTGVGDMVRASACMCAARDELDIHNAHEQSCTNQVLATLARRASAANLWRCRTTLALDAVRRSIPCWSHEVPRAGPRTPQSLVPPVGRFAHARTQSPPLARSRCPPSRPPPCPARPHRRRKPCEPRNNQRMVRADIRWHPLFVEKELGVHLVPCHIQSIVHERHEAQSRRVQRPLLCASSVIAIHRH